MVTFHVARVAQVFQVPAESSSTFDLPECQVPVQIFISYARDDDETPPGMSGTKGFVGFLYDQLNYEFRRLGEPKPRLWRDTRNIERAHQFEPILEKELAASDYLIVVLSRNWLTREWCLRELETFASRWEGAGERARDRIVVVAKHYIAPSQRPSWLQGQEGYSLFSIDREEVLADPARIGIEQEFYERGEVRDPACWGVLKQLAGYLWRQAAARTMAPMTSQGPAPSSKSAVEPVGRTIYIAKPAGDMRQAYDSLVEELQRRGYGIEPPVAAGISHDHTAPAFIAEALAKSELSIHLLGNKAGFAPEDSEPITKLQLKRAADLVTGSHEPAAAGQRRFRRIIWVPKILPEQTGTAEPERDPLAVLANFDKHLPSDKVEGDNFSKFVEFVVQHLERTAPSRELATTTTAQARVYLYHRVEDQDYALDLAVALQERQIEPIIPALEGDAADLSAHHRQNLLECDAVILCWANASEVWARASARELSEWRELGRSKRFAYRALIAGPPPAARKNILVKLPPRSDIDLVLDLTALPKPVPEALSPLVLGAEPAAS
jgi:hypothetical protein